MPHAKILFVEASVLDPFMELELRQKVDIFLQHPFPHLFTTENDGALMSHAHRVLQSLGLDADTVTEFRFMSN